MDKLARIFRAESGRILTSLVHLSKDLQLAEDACEEASGKWSKVGVPNNTGAWLHLVAKRKLIDKLRQQRSQHNSTHCQHKVKLIEESLYTANDVDAETDYEIPEERLRLIFTCCHPALRDELNQYQPYYAARGELEARLNLIDLAVCSFSRAINLSKNSIERDFLIKKRLLVSTLVG